jgi:hypothetical protein
VRAIGLQTKDSAWLWLFNRAASWANTVIEQRAPGEISNATLELENLSEGTYRVGWYDTRSGNKSAEQNVTARQGDLSMAVPPFTRDLACRVTHVSQ